MTYKFKERVQQTVVAKKDAYAAKWVRKVLDSFVAKLGGYLKTLKASIPNKAGGYTLRTSLDFKKPVWKGKTLPFTIRLLVEASHWTGWPDVIEVKIQGKLGYTTKRNGNVTKLMFDVSFEFFAKEAALPTIKEKLSEASGDKIQRNEDIRKYLKSTIQTYLQRLKKAVAAGVKDFKKVFEEAKKDTPKSDEPSASRPRSTVARGAISPFSPEALLPGLHLLI